MSWSGRWMVGNYWLTSSRQQCLFLGYFLSCKGAEMFLPSLLSMVCCFYTIFEISLKKCTSVHFNLPFSKCRTAVLLLGIYSMFHWLSPTFTCHDIRLWVRVKTSEHLLVSHERLFQYRWTYFATTIVIPPYIITQRKWTEPQLQLNAV